MMRPKRSRTSFVSILIDGDNASSYEKVKEEVALAKGEPT